MNNRTLTVADAMAVAELWLAGAKESAATDSAFHPRVSLAEYSSSVEGELRLGSIIGWGVFDGENNLLGYLTACVAQPSAEFEQTDFLYLLDLDVRSNARRRGIGTLLVQLARRYGGERGLASIEVSWLSSDVRASSFWRAQGFAPYLSRARSSIEPVAPGRDDA